MRDLWLVSGCARGRRPIGHGPMLIIPRPQTIVRNENAKRVLVGAAHSIVLTSPRCVSFLIDHAYPDIAVRHGVVT
jgi:hypothetical protein